MFLSTGNNLTNGINADTTGGTFAPGALLTVSAVLANAGKIIELSATHAYAATGNTFPVVGVVDRYDSAAGLLYFTQR